MRKRLLHIVVAGLLAFGQLAAVGQLLQLPASAIVPGLNELASVGSSGSQSNNHNRRPSISGDGRYIAFDSVASNLVPGDTNAKSDVFVRDRLNGTTSRISVSSSGSQGNNDSDSAKISRDGRYIVFASSANNLVSGDVNGAIDVFVHDMQTSTTSLVSVTSAGTIGNGGGSGPDISADGRYIVFITASSNLVTGISPYGIGSQILRKDMTTGTLEAVSMNNGVQGNASSDWPSMSCDGNVVAFQSNASNLAENDTNGRRDVFVAVRGGSEYVHTDMSIGANAESIIPKISCNGDSVVFLSDATNLVTGDTNGFRDVFEYRRSSSSVFRVSLTDSNGQSNGFTQYPPDISGDGRYVVFMSSATDLDSFKGNGFDWSYNIFMRDTVAQTTQAISRNANYLVGYSQEPVISDDGKYVAYSNLEAPTQKYGLLVPGDNNMYEDIFVSATGVRTDNTPPGVVGIPGRQPNAAGWYDGDLTISWSATDPEPSSGTPTTPVPTMASQEGIHTYISDSSCDPAGNCATGSLALSIDKSAPTISYSLSSVPNGAGWNNGDVILTFTCDDAVSGIASCTTPVTVGEGVDQTVTGSAVDLAGNTTSVGVTLNVDKTKPTISYATSPASNPAGWNNRDVTVDFQCLDDLSGVLSCASPVSLVTEGANQTVSGVAVDIAGNEQTVASSINIDKTAPSLGVPSWTANPKTTLQSSILTVSVTDGLSGVAGGEYFIGDNDPGQGNGATMDWSGTDLSTVYGTDFTPGVYKISFRAQDVAGNWSQPVSDYLVVYDPFGLSITGRRTVMPSLAAGDVLPGLVSSDQDDKARFAFNVKYSSQGVISNNSDLMFDYSTGIKCNNPAQAINCHDLKLNATNIEWLVVDGINDSRGIFQGTAALRIDGVNTTNPFRITALDGNRLDPNADDHFLLRVYAPGANPNTAAPLYQISQDVLRGNIRIR